MIQKERPKKRSQKPPEKGKEPEEKKKAPEEKKKEPEPEKKAAEEPVAAGVDRGRPESPPPATALSPAVRRIVEEEKLEPEKIRGTGEGAGA